MSGNPYSVCLIIGLLGCVNVDAQDSFAGLQDLVNTPKSHKTEAYHSYSETLLAIRSDHADFISRHRADTSIEERTAIGNEAKDYLSRKFLWDISPAWEGTLWTFNGYSKKPRIGSIACGWYVQRVLENLGFRFKKKQTKTPYFAQNWPMVMVNGIDPHGATVFLRDSLEGRTDSLFLSMEQGIYLIGFGDAYMDSGAHIGFLVNTKKELYIIHSMGRVKCLPAKEESYYVYSDFYFLGELFNTKMLDYWLEDEVIIW